MHNATSTRQLPPLDRLLAKSPRDPTRIRGEETLRGHTLMVLAAARELLAARLEAVASAARLSAPAKNRLERVVLLGAFMHDLGKCSEHFQLMLRRQREEPQLMRHEAASLWVCWPGKPLAMWLRPAVETEIDYLIATARRGGAPSEVSIPCVRRTGGSGNLVTPVDWAPRLSRHVSSRREGIWFGTSTAANR